MNKVIKNGKVAVVLQKQFGAGWYTWNSKSHTGLLFDPKIVSFVEDMQDASDSEYTELCEALENYARDTYDRDGSFYAEGLVVEYVPLGSRFYLREYDGIESIILESQLDWLEV